VEANDERGDVRQQVIDACSALAHKAVIALELDTD
jgi:hypothetical protein